MALFYVLAGLSDYIPLSIHLESELEDWKIAVIVICALLAIVAIVGFIAIVR